MKKELFRGCCTALITPFDSDGRIDFERFEEQIEYQISRCTDALVVLGTTGESPAVSDDEFLALLNFALFRVKDRIPVLAGVGKNNAQHTLDLCLGAAELGACGLLTVTPYYNKTSQQGLINYFTYIADRVKLPMILYNVPSRTGMSATAETYAALSAHPLILGVKEASRDITLPLKTKKLCGDDFYIYSGNDDMTTALMAQGASGVISVLSNILPKEVHDLCTHCLDGRFDEALALQLKYLDLVEALFEEVSPIPLKCAMKQLGRDSGYLRLPLLAADRALEHRLHNILADYGLLS